MIRRLSLAALGLVLIGIVPLVAEAQVSSRGLIDPAAARQLGLERMWYTQLSLDRGRGGLAGIHQHVSTTRMRTMFEFTHSGLRQTFSARELEEIGRPLRDVAVLAVLDEVQPANTPVAEVVKAKFRIATVLKGPNLAQADAVLELPYLGDSRKGGPFLITGSVILPGAAPVVNWWTPLSLTEQARKHLSAEGAYTPGVDRALQNAEQELARIRLAIARLNPKILPADDQLPQIDGHVIPEITLYGSSERGLVQAVDGETGRTLWSVSIGNSQFPTSVPGANDDFVALINGSQIYVLKADDGVVIWNKFAIGSPGAGPALSEDLLFVPMISGAIETYFVDSPKRPAAVFRSFGRAMTQPAVSPSSVAWPTDKGNLYVGNANVPDMRFRVEAKDNIESAPAFLSPGLVFATSRDGYVYCFSEGRGAIIWRFTTGEPISHSPVALGDTVFAITDEGNLFAINVADAVEKWTTSGVKAYVAGSDERLYCIDTAGNLAILDRKTGSLIGTLGTASLDYHLLNAQTDRILLGTRSGLLQCLREADAHYPTMHYGVIRKKKAPLVLKPGEKPPAGEDAGGRVADPFATPAGADPFAVPKPGAAAPMPPAANDPFAPPP